MKRNLANKDVIIEKLKGEIEILKGTIETLRREVYTVLDCISQTNLKSWIPKTLSLTYF